MKRYLILLFAVLLTGCTAAPSQFMPYEPSQEAFTLLPVSSKRPDISQLEADTDSRQQTVNLILSSMTTEEKVGQLFFARCPAQDGAQLANTYHLGGYILFGRDFKEKTAQQIRDDIASYQQASSIPMLIGVDEEGGTVVRVSSNPELRAHRFPSPQQLYAAGGLDKIIEDAGEKDALLQSLGINVNFAPVADLSTNPEDFIYPRTLGLGAEETAAYVSALVSKMEQDGMGSVLKHFPGYGPNEDTHTGSALDLRPLEQFQTEDFLPFQAGIQAAAGGSAAVLVSHNIMAAVDPDAPSSLSPAVHQLLREELEFQGVILTDDLAMDAAANYAGQQSPAVLALQAGNDMVVTTDFTLEIPQVLAALEEGLLTMEQIDRGVLRVLCWKYDLGLLR